MCTVLDTSWFQFILYPATPHPSVHLSVRKRFNSAPLFRYFEWIFCNLDTDICIREALFGTVNGLFKKWLNSKHNYLQANFSVLSSTVCDPISTYVLCNLYQFLSLHVREKYIWMLLLRQESRIDIIRGSTWIVGLMKIKYIRPVLNRHYRFGINYTSLSSIRMEAVKWQNKPIRATGKVFYLHLSFKLMIECLPYCSQ